MKLKTTPPFNIPTHDQTAARAKQLWESNGTPEGRDEEFWLAAERELTTANAPADTLATRRSVKGGTKSSTGLKPGDGDNLRQKTDELLDDVGEGTNRSATALNLDRS